MRMFLEPLFSRVVVREFAEQLNVTSKQKPVLRQFEEPIIREEA